MIHKLKILPEYFKVVESGEKTFEVRFNDRDFKIGDTLILQEYENGKYSGRELSVEVTYILDDPRYCKNEFVVMSIRLI